MSFSLSSTFLSFKKFMRITNGVKSMIFQIFVCYYHLITLQNRLVLIPRNSMLCTLLLFGGAERDAADTDGACVAFV